MSGVAPTTRAEWLKQRELTAVATSAGAAARWGEDAVRSQQSSLLIDPTAAAIEAERQLALLSAARAIDTVVVSGVHQDLEGTVVEIDYTGEFGIIGLGAMLVTRVRIDPNVNLTELTGEVLL